MYVKGQGRIFDPDLNFLRDLFRVLDSRLAELDREIDECPDPDSMGPLDDVDYLAGMGFVASQRYLVSTYSRKKLDKATALKLGPRHGGGHSLARILNAAANYWKHVDEWDRAAVSARDASRLRRNQRRTMLVIQSVMPWSDYLCANILYELMSRSRFSNVVGVLEKWREEVDNFELSE